MCRGYWLFPGPVGLRSHDVGAIAIAIVRQGRLHFTHSSSPNGRHLLLQRLLWMYRLDKYLGSADVAREVTQYCVDWWNCNLLDNLDVFFLSDLAGASILHLGDQKGMIRDKNR